MLFYFFYTKQPIQANFLFYQLTVLISCRLNSACLTSEVSFMLLFDLKLAWDIFDWKVQEHKSSNV